MNTNRDVAELGITRRRLLQAAAAAGAVGDITADAVDPAAAATTVGSTTDAQLFQYDARRTGSTASNGPTTSLTRLWRTSEQYAYASVPAVVNGTVYASGVNGLGAFRAGDGEQLWNFAPASTATDVSDFGILSSSPAVGDDTVYVGSSDGNLYAVRTDGSERWRYSTDGAVYSSPVVVNDTVYIGSTDGNVYAVDTNGTLQWKAGTGRPVVSSPAVANGTVYVGNGIGGGNDVTAEGSVVALDATDNGRTLWSFTPDVAGFEGDGPFYATPAVSNGTVYIGNRGRQTAVFALDAANGDKLWEFGNTPGISIDCSPAVATDVTGVDASQVVYTYAGNKFGTFYALNGDDGTPIWQFPTSEFLFADASPTVADETVFIASSGNPELYAVDAATGVQRAQFDLSSSTQSAPAITGGRLYVGGADTLQAIGTQELGVSVTALDSTVAPGDEVTLEIQVVNSTGEQVDPALSVDLPDEFTPTGRTDDGGSYTPNPAPSWTWTGVDPGETTQPTLTIRADDSAAQGAKTVDVTGSVTLDSGIQLQESAQERVTITTAPFDEVKAEKRQLASRIDTVAQTFVETPKVDAALDNLTDLVDTGELSNERAVKAVQRLKLAENVTETALVTTGRAQPDPDIGSPNSDDYDIISRISEIAANTGSSLLTTSAGFAKAATKLQLERAVRFGFGGRGPFGVTGIYGFGVSAITYGAIELYESFLGPSAQILDTLLSYVEDTPFTEILEAIVSPGSQELTNDLQDELEVAFEGSRPNDDGIKDALDEATARLAGQNTGSGKPEFSGSAAAAERASEAAISDIRGTVSATAKTFEKRSLIGKLIELVNAVLELYDLVRNAGPIASVITQVVGILANVSALINAFTLLNSGFITLETVQMDHRSALQNIVDP